MGFDVGEVAEEESGGRRGERTGRTVVGALAVVLVLYDVGVSLIIAALRKQIIYYR